MTAVTLDGYFVRVRNKNKSQALPLGNFDAGASVPRIIHGYLRQLAQGGSNIPELFKSARVERLKIDGSFCTGILSVGEYGYETDIINTDTGVLSYKK
jgi:hypothetical protein